MKTRSDALQLLKEWVQSESLRNHCLAVACAMEGYAKKMSLRKEESDIYWITGLLHDMDYERYPDISIHPIKGCEELRKEGYPEEIIEAILGHNEATGIKRYTKMAKTLFAVDELSGLIVALSKVRPSGFSGMNAKSVDKVMRKKDFAANINRDDIRKGMDEIGVSQDEHFQTVIDSLSNMEKEKL
ncbi:HAD family hydrolase [Candidatus Pacearchaeota archaeon CG_4_9_14_0_2_um_filter_39_13]|nr:HDIG domain-containing protein [Candidatus Pacearchaeota archaeon]OIO42827.1 MAG: hypothetical protein AUJ64_03495 [Candidatus Pacearchaeota archaeon CG1_02_39_14]PJC45075.1 MAG: HAD family hydrolase [Candidatus Pacearchaeota archaeon CG_4_9_14_0_2_um_filter_39_13]